MNGSSSDKQCNHRTRWAAIGAAVVVALGGGGLAVHATSSSGERDVFIPITPCRLFDTRSEAPVGPRTTPIGPGATFAQAVRGTNGNCTIANDATAVAMNVTVVNGTAASFLTVWPSDAPRPLASSLNWTAGSPPTPNKVDVKLAADGSISLFNNVGTVDVLADVVGYYSNHDHDDRYYTKAQLESGPSNIGVSQRMSKTQIALGQWWQDPGRSTAVTLGANPNGLAFDGTHVWATEITANRVREIDAASGAIVATVTDPAISHPFGIAFDGSGLWVANQTSNKIVRIDPTTATVTRTISIPNLPSAVVFDGTALWVTLDATGVVRVDPTTGAVSAAFATGFNPYSMVFDGTNVWIANNGTATLSKVNTVTLVGTNPASNLGSAAGHIVFDGTHLWITEGANAVRALDPTTGSYFGGSILTSNSGPLAFDGHHLWESTSTGLMQISPLPGSTPINAGTIPGTNIAFSQMIFDGTSLWSGTATGLAKFTP